MVNVGYLVASSLLGGLFGLFEAEVIAFSLLEISISPAFAIVFGVGFCLLAIALTWRIWVSVPGHQKYILLFFSAMVLASGIACFFLKSGWIKDFHSAGKVPLYAILGMSFAFTITYSFSEIVTLSPWDKCCNTNGQENPVFGSPQQIFALFGCSLSLGICFGLLFGLIDVEDDNSSHSKLTSNTIYAVPLGVVIGALFGLGNEWFRERRKEPALPQQEPKEHDDLL